MRVELMYIYIYKQEGYEDSMRVMPDAYRDMYLLFTTCFLLPAISWSSCLTTTRKQQVVKRYVSALYYLLFTTCYFLVVDQKSAD
jgi:hypothetical protein